MFVREDKSEKRDFDFKILELQKKHELEKKEIESNHKLELKEKEFELKHFKDEKVKELEKKIQDQEVELAELKKENEMLDRVVAINADIIDVKNLVSKLIDKLPSIDLKSLTVNNNGNNK